MYGLLFNLSKRFRTFLAYAFLQDDETFWTHVEEQIGDAEVGQETETLLKYLVVGDGDEGRVCCVGSARRDEGAEVGGEGQWAMDNGQWRMDNGPVLSLWKDEVGGALVGGVDVEQLGNESDESFVEIEEEAGGTFVEGGEVVGIIFEERRMTIGTANGIPVMVAPVAVVADA